ncbi:MAG: hypothetical protein KIT17_01305 [Rubrivivax sp.]|nr:hypothetical protein [Rubrivivax sp.]
MSALGCGPGHHGVEASAASPGLPQTVAHHAADPAVAASQDGSSQVVVIADPPSADVQTQGGAPKPSTDDLSKSLGKAGKLKCNACAPCCAAAAPAFDPAPAPRAELGSCIAALEDACFVGVILDVPHQPPRLILA